MSLNEDRLKAIDEKLDKLIYLLEKNIGNSSESVIGNKEIKKPGIIGDIIEDVKPFKAEINKEPEVKTDKEVNYGEISNENQVSAFGTEVISEKTGATHFEKYINKVNNRDTSGINSEKYVNDIKNPKISNSSFGDFMKNNELVLGKYLIGVFSAVLLFIASISFVMMVYNQISDAVKLSVLIFIGLGLTALGFLRIKKDKDTIASIILGTGAGVTYISILSATLVFHFISNNIAIILCGIWAIFFILSSKYTNLFFTTVISYIGSYIALIFGLGLFTSGFDFIALLLFVISVVSVMIYTSYLRNNKEFIISICLSMFSFISILFYSHIFYFRVATVLSNPIYQIFILLIVYVLLNGLFKFTTKAIVFIPAAVCVSLSTIITVIYASLNYYHMTNGVVSIIIIFIHLLQFVINILRNDKNEYDLTAVYSMLLAIFITRFNLTEHDILSGSVLVGILLILRNKWLNKNDFMSMIYLFLVIDCVLSFVSLTYSPFKIVYSFLVIVCFIYYLFVTGEKYNNHALGVIILLFSCYNISYNIFALQFFLGYTEFAFALFHLLSMGGLYILYRLDYFDDKAILKWKNKYFAGEWLLNITLGILYLLGLAHITCTYNIAAVYTVIFTTLIIMLASSNLLAKKSDSASVCLYILLKYLIFIWCVLSSLFDVEFNSYLYSVSGLIVALVSIYLGFTKKIKFIRQYGLGLTIIMVAKYILVDIRIENSITRVVSYVVGSLVCFLISYIYNKLAKTYE